MVPFIEKVADVIGDEHCGFQTIAEFMGFTEESHIMIHRHLIQELKDHRDDYVEDGCPLPPSSTKWHNHNNEDAMTWEDEYLDQHDLFRDLMIFEKGEKPPQPKKESNKAEPILCDTPEKAMQQFEVIGGR
ncbi:hypothetical protein MTR_4g019660 [Medicago truncatula]|uniref:Uncharacterized protein n=1 Tax=Medicago truncatula TaxID=3880 RepID=A0A072UGU1_MEDTR|nr:hypothetical protein MTR_4g019660 [Medicago truncatula]